MYKELKEDFDRWWVTAAFQEKMSLAVSLSLIVFTALSMITSMFKPRVQP